MSSWKNQKKSAQLGADPFKRTYEWSSPKKAFTYYQKFPEGGGENVVADKLQVVVVDELYAISGFSEDHNTGYYSNMVRSLKDNFFVRLSGKNQVVEGCNGVPALFSDGSKNMVLKSKGMKSTRVLIAWDTLYENSDGSKGAWVKIMIAGSAYSGYINLTNKLNTKSLVGYWVAFTGKTTMKKQGIVEYNVPTLLGGELDLEKPNQKAMDDAVEENYEDIEAWIKNYLNADAKGLVDSGEAKPDNQETNLQTGPPAADNFPTQEPTTFASTGGAHTEEDDLPF